MISEQHAAAIALHAIRRRCVTRPGQISRFVARQARIDLLYTQETPADVKNPNRAKGDQQPKPSTKLQGAARAQLPFECLRPLCDQLRNSPRISFELLRIPK